MDKCVKCGKTASGSACAVCMEKCDVHNDTEHKHEGRNFCMLVCEGCGKPEVLCVCEREDDNAEEVEEADDKDEDDEQDESDEEE